MHVVPVVRASPKQALAVTLQSSMQSGALNSALGQVVMQSARLARHVARPARAA
jgi:hypothetical protein